MTLHDAVEVHCKKMGNYLKSKCVPMPSIWAKGCILYNCICII